MSLNVASLTEQKIMWNHGSTSVRTFVLFFAHWNQKKIKRNFFSKPNLFYPCKWHGWMQTRC